MRNISFALTPTQLVNGSKTQTRRLGWLHARPGDQLCACLKCMGRRPGEPLVRLAIIQITDTRREPLNHITPDDVVAEGFPNLKRAAFCLFFADSHKGCQLDTPVTVLTFRLLALYSDARSYLPPFSGAHSMSITTPETKTDRNGNYYALICPRGFANETSYFRVAPTHVDQAAKEVEAFNEARSEPGDNGSAQWVDAGHGNSGQPGVAIDYDPNYGPARIYEHLT
ncbi:MAG: hypothetical protein AAF593_00230 [Planctomycetota bacterium]